MTKENLKDILKNIIDTNKMGIEDGKLDTVVSEIDIDGIMSKTKAAYTISIWDRKTPINGVDPSYILNQVPFTLPDWDGLTYTVSRDGKTEMIQYDDFRVQGWQPIKTEEEAFILAELSIQPLIEHVVLEEALSKLRGE